MDVIGLNTVFRSYVAAPTRQNQEALMTAAEEFRDAWIESRSLPAKSDGIAARRGKAPTRYKAKIWIGAEQPDGTELTLALQSRTSDREDMTWNVVSWRTRLRPGGPNRRFYVSDGDIWSIDARLALDLLSGLDAKGGLDPQYDDLARRPDFVVKALDGLGEPEQRALLDQSTLEGEDWGNDPILVALGDPNDDWRKIMIINRETAAATFRSTTRNATYMPRKTLRAGSEWYLDNSMQDTNVQQARYFLEQLRVIVPSLRSRAET